MLNGVGISDERCSRTNCCRYCSLTMDNGVAKTSANQPLHLDPLPPTSSTTRSRARSISQALPSLRISTSPTSVSPPAILSAGVSNRAPRELRNLLAHLLSRLGARTQAPSVYEELRADSTKKDLQRFGVVVETVRSAVRFKGVRELSVSSGGDGEEEGPVENEQGFSTDTTYEHMVQLRDILILSDNRGWQILDSTFVRSLIHASIYS